MPGLLELYKQKMAQIRQEAQPMMDQMRQQKQAQQAQPSMWDTIKNVGGQFLQHPLDTVMQNVMPQTKEEMQRALIGASGALVGATTGLPPGMEVSWPGRPDLDNAAIAGGKAGALLGMALPGGGGRAVPARAAQARMLMAEVDAAALVKPWLSKLGIAQGFDKGMYHTTKSPGFSEFSTHVPGNDFGVHMTPSTRTADEVYYGPTGIAEKMRAYPTDEILRDAYDGPADFYTAMLEKTLKKHYRNANGVVERAIMPLQVKMDNPFPMPDQGNWTTSDGLASIPSGGQIIQSEFGKRMLNLAEPHSIAATHAAKDLIDVATQQKEMYNQFLKSQGGSTSPMIYDDAQKVTEWMQMRAMLGEQWRKLFPQVLDGHGFDGVKYINKIEGRGEPSYMSFNPENIRLPWAAFKDLKSKNLLASIVPPMAAGAMGKRFAQEKDK